MPIDEPLSQAQNLVESDRRQGNPFAEYALDFAKILFSLSNPVAAVGEGRNLLKGALSRRTSQNVDYLLSVIIDELRRWSVVIDDLRREHRDFLDNDWAGLLTTAAAKARDSHSNDKIRRSGIIVANSAQVGPETSADEVEEFLRIGTILDSREVAALNAIVVKQHSVLHDGQVGRTQAKGLWPVETFRKFGFQTGDLFSMFAKLESLGLIANAIPRNLNDTYQDPGPYGLLQKGKDFIDFVKASVESAS